jgi:hypothetical protein
MIVRPAGDGAMAGVDPRERGSVVAHEQGGQATGEWAGSHFDRLTGQNIKFAA